MIFLRRLPALAARLYPLSSAPCSPSLRLWRSRALALRQSLHRPALPSAPLRSLSKPDSRGFTSPQRVHWRSPTSASSVRRARNSGVAINLEIVYLPLSQSGGRLRKLNASTKVAVNAHRVNRPNSELKRPARQVAACREFWHF